MKLSFLREILPDIINIHFDLVCYHKLGNVREKTMELELHLDELNILPEGYCTSEYESKGFLPSSRIQDFPIRGQAVYLVIRRRRWRNKFTGKELRNDYSFTNKGAKLTQELSDFLKDTNRYS
ncbi:hypothetical protein [Winogradskyella sp.]|uniref:ISAon1 family transposase N-terminal region protein n=1 Tax=Winogradskyella sp. TaxID=1883156 RepID=UPI0025E32B4D|nr:hypothetical protein [Winogradskyella sp.]MBT8245732.1 transposase family protein [Winogradskyella sp.]